MQDEKNIPLVVGADGTIGRALAARLKCVGEIVLETTRRAETSSENRIFLNLAEDVSGWSPPCKVSVAYFCAAVTSIKQCQQKPEQSRRVNVQNTIALAKTLVGNGTFVIFPSTNLVYDGSVPFRRADEPLSPQTDYGRQKAEAERQLLALGESISVVRFTKVLSPNMSLFLEWIHALKKGEIIHPFSDMVLAPVPLHFAVDVLLRIADIRLPGVVQVSGEKEITYEQAARHIAQRVSANPDQVQPVESEKAGIDKVSVPTHTTLDTTRLRKELGLIPPDVWATIDSVVSL